MRGLVVGLALGLGGCASGLDLGRATTLAVGEERWSAGAHYAGTSPHLTDESDFALPWVQAEAGYHRGISPRVEAGGRVWGFGWPYLFTTVGGAVDGKVQLLRGPVNVALAGSIQAQRDAIGGAPMTIGGVTVPLLVGFDMGPHQWVFSPRVGLWAEGSYGQRPIVAASVGLGTGVWFDLGPVELAPEICWQWSPVGFDGTVHVPERSGLGGVELGLGVSW